MELRIGGGAERLDRQHRRSGVMTVGVRRLGRKAGDDHVGAEAADHRHHVGQHRRLPPDPQRLLGALREAEVAGPGEELLAPVDAPRRQELLRPDQAQGRPLLCADQVLSAVAARDREIPGSHQLPVGQVRDERGVLVVGVGGDIEDAADHAQLAQPEREPRRIRLRRRAGGVRGGRKAERQGDHE
jgi:hypothetical protein